MQRVIKIIHTESSEPRRKQEETMRNKKRLDAWLFRLQKSWRLNSDKVARDKRISVGRRILEFFN